VDIEKSDGTVISAPTGSFLPIDEKGDSPQESKSSIFLLKRLGLGKKKRYDFCFNCHQVGGRGELKRGWSNY
jgi:hypothetical protein